VVRRASEKYSPKKKYEMVEPMLFLPMYMLTNANN